MKTLRSYLVTLLPLLPVLATAFFIISFAVNVAVFDQWFFVPLFGKMYTGQLSLADLLAQHNEHRPFFSRLVMLALGHFTAYDTRVEMYLGFVFLCLATSLLFFRFRTDFAGHLNREQLSLYFFPATILLFSWRQHESFLYGWNFMIFMCFFCFVAAMYLLEQANHIGIKFIGAAFAGIVASFTFASGLFTWPIGVVCIVWKRYRRPARVTNTPNSILAAWIAIGGLIFVFYFHDYKSIGYSSLIQVLHNPLAIVSYLLVTFGAALIQEPFGAAGIGSLILLLYSVVLLGTWRSGKCTQLPSFMPLALVLLSLISQVLMIFGRWQLGLNWALTSRYSTVGLIGLVGLYWLVVPGEDTTGWLRPYLVGVFLALLIAGGLTSYLNGFYEGRASHLIRQRFARYLVTFRSQPDELLGQLCLTPRPDPELVRKGAVILEKYHLNVFHLRPLDLSSLITLPEATQAAVEVINGISPNRHGAKVVDVSQSSATRVSGWAVDSRMKKAAAGVFVQIGGHLTIRALYGLERADVARFFRNPRYRFSGFSARIRKNMLQKGRQSLKLLVVSNDKKHYYRVDTGIILKVH